DPDAKIQIENPASERVTSAMTAQMRDSSPRGSVNLLLGSVVEGITPDAVLLRDSGGAEVQLKNDVVFTMIGREAPLDFFRRSGVKIRGEWTPAAWTRFLLFGLFCVALYHWKAGSGFALYDLFKSHHWFPFNVADWLAALGDSVKNPKGILSIIAGAAGAPSFYYSLVYCLLIVVFGVRRIFRRKTPYVTAQTLTLIAVQVVPLFLLPYLVLPWMGANGWFDAGFGKWFADQFFPVEYGARTYWRAFGFIL